ncbi:MAG: hypothetical protein GY765_01585, partial [bacterium]|nr:hypothetical protein [bacterium]
LTDREYRFITTYRGSLQSYLEPYFIFRREYYAGQYFDVNRFHWYFACTPTTGVRISKSGKIGTTVDYSNFRKGKIFRTRTIGSVGIGKHLTLNLNHLYEKLNYEGSKVYAANILQGQLIYNFNVRMFIRAILQYTDIDRNPEAYLYPRNDYKTFFSQFLFSYKLNPQTVLFLGYSDNQYGNRNIDLTRTNRTFFLKIGYAFLQ